MKRRCHLIRNQKGMTMIELLAVIVILGILSAVAVPLMGNLIQEAKDRAFVSNAYSMKEAASLNIRAQLKAMEESGSPVKIYYHQLVNQGFLEPFRDPDTGEMMRSEVDIDDQEKSYVEIRADHGNITYFIFLKGFERQIGTADVPILVDDIKDTSIINTP